MNLILGHTNTDLDCLGSMALARLLYPDHILVRSRFIHPVAQNLFNLYKNYLDMAAVKDLPDEPVESVVIVDTRSRTRVREFFEAFKIPPSRITIFDHHPGDSRDIEGAELTEGAFGANTTLLGRILLERGIKPDPQAATIALTGIYADTGNFTHENVTPEDFRAASFFVESGASLSLVKLFLKPLTEEYQITIFHEVLNRLAYKEINGHPVTFAYLEMEKQEGGLAAVIEKTFEVENCDAIFGVFAFRKEGNVLIIGRSQRDTIDLTEILGVFGGGGHPKAASALLKGMEGRVVFHALERYLETALVPALTAEKLMSPEVHLLREGWSLKDASIFLERIEHTGAPVVNEAGDLTGFMTLLDIMKGRKSNQMHAPVKGYMSKKVITATPDTVLRDIERTMQMNNIGHLPIVSGGRIVGIVTRSDFLRAMEKRPAHTASADAPCVTGGV